MPSIVLQGAANGVAPPLAVDTIARRFSGPYSGRIVPDVGHDVLQEAPEIFADAAGA